MKIEERLIELINELDRLHPDGTVDANAWRTTDGNNTPNFVTTKNGYERHFSKLAQSSLSDLAGILYENDTRYSSVMNEQEFSALVRQCVADAHAMRTFDLTVYSLDQAKKSFTEIVAERASLVARPYTHYIPAWTLGMETETPFVLGPVVFMTVDQWLTSVEFSLEITRWFASTPEQNMEWKKSLQGLLRVSERPNTETDQQKDLLANTIYRAIKDCSSILKITITDHEFQQSRKIAEIACKSALDSVSLLFGGREYYYQQSLGNERLPPFSSSDMVEIDGFLTLPGWTLGPRAKLLNYSQVRDYLSASVQVEHLSNIGSILKSLIQPNKSKHPKLSKRWATALDWYAEGQRERNDAVALAKLATSLDVLACGGKCAGILEMLTNLMACKRTTKVTQGRHSLTLEQVVKRIYDKGRSQILHGTEIDRLKSFEAPRNFATFFGRLALLETATRLNHFTGPDGDKEFRSMPA